MKPLNDTSTQGLSQTRVSCRNQPIVVPLAYDFYIFIVSLLVVVILGSIV